jgi:hypothetical protein
MVISHGLVGLICDQDSEFPGTHRMDVLNGYPGSNMLKKTAGFSKPLGSQSSVYPKVSIPGGIWPWLLQFHQAGLQTRGEPIGKQILPVLNHLKSQRGQHDNICV